jgi:hypothetical protein
MDVDDLASALLSLGIGLGVQRALNPELRVQVLSDVIRVMAGLPAAGRETVSPG